MTIKMLGDREQVQSIEAGDTIELLRRSLPKAEMPEVLTSQRQKDPRDQKIAALFRDGNAEEAFAMKRKDGTARLIEGDYDQVVEKIADFYMARNDRLRAKDPSLSVTLTTLTNTDAAAISRAIRQRLKARGEIGEDGTVHKAVTYKGDKPDYFDLPIATGDKLRLYRKTMTDIDGKLGSIGNNGDIVEVMAKSKDGLVLRNARGLEAHVAWKRLADHQTGRLLLGFGRVFTIDAAQGMSTKGEHINALPHGTTGSTGFKTYTGESRATGQTHTLISKAAVLSAVKLSKALGDATPISEADLWQRIAKDTSDKSYKGLATDLVSQARAGRKQTIAGGLSSHHRIENAALKIPDLGHKILKSVEASLAGDSFQRQRTVLKDMVQRSAGALNELAQLLKDILMRSQFNPPADRTTPAPSSRSSLHHPDQVPKSDPAPPRPRSPAPGL
jgi:hypothetical protein